MGKLLCQKCGEEIPEKTHLRLVIEEREIVIEESLCEECLEKHFKELSRSSDFHSYLVSLLTSAKDKQSLLNLKFLIEKSTGLKVWPDIAKWQIWFEKEGRNEMFARHSCRVRLFSLIRIMRLSKDTGHRKRIAKVLTKCTGEDFGTDARKWEEWMEGNPKRITGVLEQKLIYEAAKLKDRWAIK